MTTENLQELLDPLTDGASSIWDARDYRALTFSIEWISLSVLTAEIEIQVSTDKVNWVCYGGDNGKFVMDAASGYQVMEITSIAIPYWRLNYTKNGNTTGQIIIRTYGKPLFRNVG